MKKLFLVAVTLFCIATSSAQTTNNTESFVEIIGHSQISLTPDTFFVVITINEGDSKGRITVAEQQTKMISEFEKIGINTTDELKINSLSSAFEKRTEAYSAVSYTLRLTSEKSLIEAFDILDRLYISNVYLERTESSNYEQAKSAARKEALQQAQAAATEMAEALNQEIGACFYISDLSNDFTPSGYVARPASYLTRANSATTPADIAPLEVKAIEVNYRVKTKFYLK